MTPRSTEATRSERILSLLFAILLTFTVAAPAQQIAPSDPALGLRVGAKRFEASVPASGTIRTAVLTDLGGQEVIIVVRGTFVYSQRPGFPPGRQDAKYRWGSRHVGNYCLCTDANRDNLSFVIDGRYREPVREHFDSHTYVYTYRVDDGGSVTFQIRDDNYTDNMGALEVAVYERG